MTDKKVKAFCPKPNPPKQGQCVEDAELSEEDLDRVNAGIGLTVTGCDCEPSTAKGIAVKEESFHKSAASI